MLRSAREAGGFWPAARAFLHARPALLQLSRVVRSASVLGPWRSLATRYYQATACNPALPEFAGPTLFPGIDVDAMTQTLHRAGFACGLRMPEAQVGKIVEFAKSRPASYHPDPHEHSEAVRRVAFDRELLSVVRRYHGVEPLFVGSYLWWSAPPEKFTPFVEALPHAQKFHFDVSDFRSLVVFFYLTDVDEDCAPHVVIEGTHSRKTVKQVVDYYLTDGKALELFPGRIRVITGPKGTGFYEEQTIFHKQAPPRKPRLMLALSYALRRKGLPQV
ncbi:MAG: hypothetical protein ACHQ49_06115 [Elusimicrobiota bacterium]